MTCKSSSLEFLVEAEEVACCQGDAIAVVDEKVHGQRRRVARCGVQEQLARAGVQHVQIGANICIGDHLGRQTLGHIRREER